MKTILIEQVANGWMVTDRDTVHSASYAPGEIHVYQSIKDLQTDLPNLLNQSPKEIIETALGH